MNTLEMKDAKGGLPNTAPSMNTSTTAATETAVPMTDAEAQAESQFQNPVTLRELLGMIGSTKGKKTPSKIKLQEMSRPITCYQSGDYRITVFKNGFALVESGKRWTVIRVDKCGDYTYEHHDFTLSDPEYTAPQTVTSDVFMNEKWPVRIMLAADDRLMRNNDAREQKLLSKHALIPNDKDWMNGSFSSFEDQVIFDIDMENELSRMTEKKRTAVQLYRKGYTQQEIADKRGVSYGAIGQSPKSSFAQLEKALM